MSEYIQEAGSFILKEITWDQICDMLKLVYCAANPQEIKDKTVFSANSETWRYIASRMHIERPFSDLNYYYSLFSEGRTMLGCTIDVSTLKTGAMRIICNRENQPFYVEFIIPVKDIL